VQDSESQVVTLYKGPCAVGTSVALDSHCSATGPPQGYKLGQHLLMMAQGATESQA